MARQSAYGFIWPLGGVAGGHFFLFFEFQKSELPLAFSFNLEIPNIWSQKYQRSIKVWRKCQLFKLGCGKLCQEDTLGSLTSFNLECPTSLSFCVVVWCFNNKNKKSLNWILDSTNKLNLKKYQTHSFFFLLYVLCNGHKFLVLSKRKKVKGKII